MRRAEIDAWLARADDVLTDWDGSADAMHAGPTRDDADPELPLLGDNTADQVWPLPRRRPPAPPSPVGRALRAVRRVLSIPSHTCSDSGRR